jgi:hypothetical protein
LLHFLNIDLAYWRRYDSSQKRVDPVLRLGRFAALSFLLFIFFHLATSAQRIIDNPATLHSKNAGRVVSLTEVLTITDLGQDQYYFEYPLRLHIAPDGSVFVLDRDQLLEFDQKGRFVRNYFKKGQGPGELTFVSNFWLTASHLIVHNSSPGKVAWFDFMGNPVKDTAVRSLRGALEFLLFDGESYLFRKSSFSEKKGMQGVIENPQTIVSWREDDDGTTYLGQFPIQAYFKKSRDGAAGLIPLNKLILISSPETLYLSHTSEYLVKAIELKTGRIKLLIRRPYDRVKQPPELAGGIRGGATIDGKPLVAPPPDYADDIVNLFLHGEDLWVATSARDKDKGTLIDVFDAEGRYIDCFYLELPVPPYRHLGLPPPHIVSGDFLYAIEKNPDDTFSIKKYRIGL